LECVLRTLGLPPNIESVNAQTEPSWIPGTFKEFMDAYAKTVLEAVEDAVKFGNQRDAALARYSPVPFLSSTLAGCIENARDKTAGGAVYNFTGCNGQCLSSAANSLAGVKKIVYDEKRISLQGFREVLASNWEGQERLRQYALNRVPKFGNDDDYVDSIAVRVADIFINGVLGNYNPRGGPYYPGLFTFHHVARGLSINASPDGRRAGDPVSQHLSPAVGTDKSGPTLAIRSALKVSGLLPPEGSAFDLRFHPSALRGEEGTKNLTSFVKAFMEQGGLEIQFNVVDSETLREAQRHPERFQSLIVRVWGFSAYFVTLTSEYQEEIIARTAHV
jgi:formate C-acetyltransferase